MRARLTLAAGSAVLALAGSVFAASPALALTPCSNPGGTGCANVVSVTLTGAGLTIGTADSGTVTLTGGTLGSLPGALTGNLPTTTVTDNRGTFVGWTASAVTDGDLVDGTVGKIALSASGPLQISSTPLTAVTGLLPSTVPSVVGGGLWTTPVTIFTMPAAGSVLAGATGGGSYSFTPSLSLTVPAGTRAGTYTTTVTQTVV